jgi:hypothetical protein
MVRQAGKLNGNGYSAMWTASALVGGTRNHWRQTVKVNSKTVQSFTRRLRARMNSKPAARSFRRAPGFFAHGLDGPDLL